MIKSETFLSDSNAKVIDPEHRRKINFNIDKYTTTVEKGKLQYADMELARERASNLKGKVLENLEKYIIEFETNFTKRGGKVIWADTAAEALKEITNILNKRHVKSIVKSKSMITEEIELNEHLEHNGIEVFETDLGEFIVQLAGQKPYHIVTPAMHMSKSDISKLFHEKLNIPETDDAQKLTLAARHLLRNKYLEAGAGISGANFLISDIGGVAITENEGNARFCTTFPRIHIAIAGIEKLIPSMTDLSLFWPLLSTRGTGQNVTVYNTILSGPRQAYETDGPDEMYVVLLNNGRTNLLAKPEKREALKCIRCGACLNVCPVYKNIGGHTYNTTYSGPIGSIITPNMKEMSEFKHLSFASSLCGACTEVCPVKIEIHKILLLNRKESVTLGLTSRGERFAIKMWALAMKKRSRMDMVSSKAKNFFLNTFFAKAWGNRRMLPNMPPKSFNKLWKDRQKNV